MHARHLIAAVFAAAAAAMPVPACAEGEVVRIKGDPNARILDAARVNAGADMVYVSGQLASPIDPAMPMSEVGSLKDMGDTRTQAISVLGKIRDILAAQGFSMSDVIKLTLFVAADPTIGRMDFAGVNAGFGAIFGTAENPETVARSTFEVAGLVGPYYLIEIEAIAAKAPAPTP
jgi:2-iminobutanoate/2-iminopropanoate deaminase